jgi:hypothetical protein
MRLWIAAFLLFLFACQTLPVVVLGKALAKAQISAIDDDNIDDDEGSPAGNAAKVKKQSPVLEEDYLHHGEDVSALFGILAARCLSLHRADNLLTPYAGEVTTPPPDFC